MNRVRKLILGISLLISAVILRAEEVNIISFESAQVGSEWKSSAGSKISISGDRYFHGKQSLLWEWNKSSELSWTGKIGYIPVAEKTDSRAIASFSFWIYNEKPLQDSMKVSFSKDGREVCYINYGLNFKGWRTAWVAYERDMQGTPEKGMNGFKFIAPKTVEQGRLIIDQVIPNTFIDPRHHISDYQVPFVNPGIVKAANKHWLALYHFSRQKSDVPMKNVVSRDEQEGFDKMLERYEQMFLTPKVKEKDFLKKSKEKYNRYEIVENEDEAIGKNVVFPSYWAVYGEKNARNRVRRGPLNTVELKECVGDMLFIAQCYRNAGSARVKARLKRYFINMYKNMHYWGWADGSGLGSLHHLGYSMRNFYPALLLMKEPLREAGLLDEAQKAMYWFSGNGKTHQPLHTITGINSDVMNTTALGQLASILILDNSTEKLYQFETYARWMNHGLRIAPGLKAPFKPDGSIFHHYNHYTKYGSDALEGISPVVYVISKTPFRLLEEGHNNIRRTLLMMRTYTNHSHFPVAMSGRHPYGHAKMDVAVKQGASQMAKIPFYWLAKAGTADATAEMDGVMASAFLRLAKNEPKTFGKEIAELKGQGYVEEKVPEGNWSMNYGCSAIHRKDNAMVHVKGFSRYLWGSEVYIGANYYGRYISYGNIQVLDSGPNDDTTISGYHMEGWDWNRWPGSTTIHLPIDKLKNDVLQMDHLSGFEELTLSNQTFAGSLSLSGKYGMFALKLSETDKYNGSHRANKTVFMFDDHVIALGSDIENDVAKYPTETTVFQANLKSKRDFIVYNGEEVSKQGYSKKAAVEKATWLVDNYKLGYYIPKGKDVTIELKHQESKHPANCSVTEGNFASVVFNHGNAPKNEEYEYAMVINTSPDKMKSFAEKQSEKEDVYEVIKKDKQAHILHYKPENITAFALFDPSWRINDKYLKSVNIPVMTMIQENSDDLITLSVCDPDLRLYKGIDHDQVDENGKQVEVSIYSRPWASSESMPSLVHLRMKGKWRVAGGDKAESAFVFKDQTTLIVKCQHAMAKEFKLERIK